MDLVTPVGLWGGVAFPIFARTHASGGEFAGTGFVPVPGVFVTCWHCVSGAAGGLEYEVAVPPPIGLDEYADVSGSLPLREIERDGTGCDLATAAIEYTPPAPFELAADPITAGDDVWTVGFPLTTPTREHDGIHWYLDPRYLRGYIVREFRDPDHRPFKPQPAYELDMPAPEGVSGAPLLIHDRPRRLRLAGVVYGARDSHSIAEMEQQDPETGTITPEKLRVVQFGLAHQRASVAQLSGTATGGRPIKALLPSA